MTASICWQLWKHRNKLMFEGGKEEKREVLDRAMKNWREWTQQESHHSDFTQERVIHRWKPPRNGKLKVNCDTAYNSDTRQGKITFIRQKPQRRNYPGRSKACYMFLPTGSRNNSNPRSNHVCKTHGMEKSNDRVWYSSSSPSSVQWVWRWLLGNRSSCQRN